MRSLSPSFYSKQEFPIGVAVNYLNQWTFGYEGVAHGLSLHGFTQPPAFVFMLRGYVGQTPVAFVGVHETERMVLINIPDLHVFQNDNGITLIERASMFTKQILQTLDIAVPSSPDDWRDAPPVALGHRSGAWIRVETIPLDQQYYTDAAGNQRGINWFRSVHGDDDYVDKITGRVQ